MSGSPGHEINEAVYQWCVRAFTLLRHRLGINIKVHDADGHFEAGQIFLFNHFARFETIIPQYLIYQATGAFCRCVAASELFEANDSFTKFLWGVGAVPNNHPGLLAFLAAETLRGRKIIFFPEGGMIKDRRVVDDDGQYGVYSPTAHAVRKHHQGPAALASTLEAYKRRILSIHETGDTARLDRWMKALGLASIDALLAAARQPTIIVPANITFYPIHTGDNILRKAAELFGADLSGRAREELLIEGNLLLKRTDMDIRFGKQIRPQVAWNLWERQLLKRAFEQTDSLDEMFALKKESGRWIERLVATAMRRETTRLRDICMQEIYARVTVNLNHLASYLILQLLERGKIEIGRRRFHRLLYAAIKYVQSEPHVRLHRSLANPELYDGIHRGTCAAFDQFLETASVTGLIEATPDRYRFLPKLRQAHGFHEMRLENVIAVYANEIGPIPGACQAVDAAIANEPHTDRAATAKFLFDDELRAYAWCKEHYARPRHAAINDQETASESGKPFLLLPARPRDIGIVLVHGLLASPAEVHGFGERLATLGYNVVGVRLAGHGTSPWDLRDRSWHDWRRCVQRGYEIMSGLCERVCLIGFSTGGALALHLAADRPAGLAGVAAIAPPLKFVNRNMAFVPIMHGINKLTEWGSSLEGLIPFRSLDSEHPHINYRHAPIRGLFELRRAIDEMERRLGDVDCPVSIIQGTDDPVVDPKGAELIFAKLGSAEKSFRMVASQRHGILYEDIANTQELTLAFLQSLSPETSHAEVSAAAAPTPSAAHAEVMDVPGIGNGTLDTSGPFLSRERMRMVNIADFVSRSLRPILAPFRNNRPDGVSPPGQLYSWERSYPKGIDWRATIEPRPLTALLDDAVKTYADKICMTFRGKHYRYRDVGRLVDRAAKGFQALGVGKGIKVALMLPNCPYAVICFYGVLKAGGTVVNVNPLYAAPEIERQIADSGACVLVTLDVKELYTKVADLADGRSRLEKLVVCRMSGALRFVEKMLFDLLKSRAVAAIPDNDRHVLFERLIDNDGAVAPLSIDPLRDIAVLQYTGGTTGSPKAARLTHANLYINTEQLALWAPETRPGLEKSLAVLPLFHCFGMTAIMNLSLRIGAEMILVPKFQPAEILEIIDQAKPTIFMGVPTMYSALIAVRDIAKYDLSSIRFCISGGAPLPSPLQRRFQDLCGCTLVEGYGLSETSPVCTVNPLSGGGKPGSVGLPLPGTVITIVSLEDPDRILEPGERGEICVSGPQVMAGYADRAKENVDIFRGQRLHTGDVGYLDDDGYLFVVDRIKDLVISGGFNVYPRHVEEIIHQHPAVAEVAVVGVADAHRGEVVKAFVQLRAGESLTAAELREFLKDKLAPFQMPRHIAFRDNLPKTLIGKISKKDLIAETTPEPEPHSAPVADA
jgi:acyl-CoA synthetase (AMP-forming)/AMP-acid ligase II/esterase/lipase